MNAKFETLSECFNVLKENNSISDKGYLTVGIDYISNEGFALSNDFIKLNNGNVELIENIGGTHITAISQIYNQIREYIAKYKI